MRPIIAIDPGASGGIASLLMHGGSAGAIAMPETHSEIVASVKYVSECCNYAQGTPIVAIEEVPKFIRDLPSSSIFVMAQNHGLILGACLALGLEVRRVRPQEWQKGLGCRKDYGSGWKRHLRGRAQELFPTLKVTLATADALLILDYARRTFNTTT